MYVEYTNEPWNSIFLNSTYLQKKGKETWPAEVGKRSDWELGIHYYTLRAAQVCQLVKQGFGADAGKVKCALNAQAAVVWWGEEMLKCPLAAPLLGKPCYQIIDVLASAPYFGGELGGASYNAKMDAWLKESDGGLTSLFKELNDVALPEALRWMADYGALAKKYGLAHLGYEGGQHMVEYHDPKRPAVLDLFQKANLDPRMGDLYTKYLNGWKTSGTETMILFNNIGKGSQYGYWGLREHMFQTSSAKWDAAKNFMKTVACWWTGCDA
jgi:hypothetical protein